MVAEWTRGSSLVPSETLGADEDFPTQPTVGQGSMPERGAISGLGSGCDVELRSD